MSTPELHDKSGAELQGEAVDVVRSIGSESKQAADAPAQERTESLLAAEKRTLEMIANGASLSEVLNDLCGAIDAHAPAATSLVLLMDAAGKSLLLSAGPHVPAGLTKAFTPWPIGPNRGCCGAAAFLKQRVIIRDVTADPRWPDDYRDLAVSYGLRAAWSEPLISKDGEVLGTFAMYYAEPRTPNNRDHELIAAAGNITRIAIERERSRVALTKALDEAKRSEGQLRKIIESIPGIITTMSPEGEVESVNQRALESLGMTLEEMRDWPRILHEEDRERVINTWRRSIETGEPYDIQHRVRRADGVYRWFHVRGLAARDAQGRIVRWYILVTDIDDRKKAEDALRASEQSFRLIVDSIPGLVNTTTATGEIELANQQLLDYVGKTLEGLKDWHPLVHPEDRARAITLWSRSVETGDVYDDEHRVRRADGVYRWFHVRALPLRDTEGRIIRWYVLCTDIDDRKKAEENLRRSEAYLAEAQKLSHTGSFGWGVSSGEIYWSQETFRIFEYEPTARVTIDLIVQRTHPEDRSAVQQLIERVSREKTEFDFEHRLLMPNGSVKYLRVVGRPSKNEGGSFEFVGAVTEITERKRAEEALRRSEGYLAEGQKMTHSGSWAWNVRTLDTFWSQEMFRILDYDAEKVKPTLSHFFDRVHPEDRPMIEQRAKVESTQKERTDSGCDYRVVLADGTIKHLHSIAHPMMNDSGEISEVVGTTMDVTEQWQARAELVKAFEKLRRSEADLLEAQRLSHTGSWREDLISGAVTLSPEVFRIRGIQPDDATPKNEFLRNQIHPEDQTVVKQLYERTKIQKADYEAGYRIVLPDGTIKHLHTTCQPILNESGELVELVGTMMDVTEQGQARAELEKAFEEIKRLKDRLHDENLALREQIDQAFMFEEIVGSSPTLRTVLSSIVKVAPTNSTVLITGETGTGKELIARAIHKRSQRSGHAFISVNCASIPTSLIASELFGHEKGAFTGALQKHQGRFEQAHSGTIFLDEIGDLPGETQIALLRVLQERQFERVGGNRVVPADVRVIAATNRDLPAVIAAGAFRADLFYRLNVFPIQVPPLRKRKEDIPMLVEYYAKRYAEKMGKQIRKIDKNTLKLCQAYHWPGNIRELQNIIERSVILCSGDTFWIDPSWLSIQESARLELPGSLTETLQNQEKEMIEAALAESKGKVAGPNGAAAKLGVPPSTLDWKIKQLRINKRKLASEC